MSQFTREIIIDPAMPLIEQVREITFAEAGLDDELDFYSVAIRLGCPHQQADWMNEVLTIRAMRAKGAI